MYYIRLKKTDENDSCLIFGEDENFLNHSKSSLYLKVEEFGKSDFMKIAEGGIVNFINSEGVVYNGTIINGEFIEE